MSGLYAESLIADRAPSQPQIVDLGSADVVGGEWFGSAGVYWAYWSGSTQWHVRRSVGRLFLLEGQPDRYPGPDEPLTRWLDGRSGSFRGFEILTRGQVGEPPQLTAFVDPWASRPVYCFQSEDGISFSDKLSSIPPNVAGTEVDWAGLLETVVLGSLYSRTTALKGTRALRPGEMLQTRRGRIASSRHYSAPTWGDPQEIVRAPADTLRRAVTDAVRHTWSDPHSELLLSGGLDSRFMLSVAGPRRRAVTFDTDPKETEHARRIAETCRAAFRVSRLPPNHYTEMVRQAHLVTGGMHDPHFVNHLGLGVPWRRDGVHGVAHGYLFDTLLKGWVICPLSVLPQPRSSLQQLMGPRASVVEFVTGRGSPFAADDALALLSADGRSVVQRQLQALAAELEPRVVDGFDLSFEDRVASDISRQVHYGFLLAWYEQADVYSPIFHPALWSWYAASRPSDRYRGRALREAFDTLAHPSATVPDATTGLPVTKTPADWRSFIRQCSVYRTFVQPLWVRLNGPPTIMTLAGRNLRSPEALRLFDEGLAALETNPLFDVGAMRTALRKYSQALNDDRFLEPVLACVGAGLWSTYVNTKARHAVHRS